MNDATSVRASMARPSTQIDTAAIDVMYNEVLDKCRVVAKNGGFNWYWKINPCPTHAMLACLEQVFLRLRAQGFEIPARTLGNRHKIMIQWEYPSKHTCDATRMRYLTLVHGEFPKYAITKELYNEVMLRCYASAAEHENSLTLSRTLMVETNDQATLLLLGWNEMIFMLKEQGFEVVQYNEDTYECVQLSNDPLTIIIIW